MSSRPADLLHHHGKTQVRAGIQSIEPRQRDAAAAIGMTPQQTLQRVVMPQAIRRVLPALTSRAIEIFKMSTFASVVACVELV